MGNIKGKVIEGDFDPAKKTQLENDQVKIVTATNKESDPFKVGIPQFPMAYEPPTLTKLGEFISPEVMRAVLNEYRIGREQFSKASDDLHTYNDWAAVIVKHLGMGLKDGALAETLELRKLQMARVAALAISCLESIERRMGKAKVAGEYEAGSGY